MALAHRIITTKKSFISTKHWVGPDLEIQNCPTTSKFVVLRWGRSTGGVAGSSAPVHGSGKLSCPFRILLSFRTAIQWLSVAKLRRLQCFYRPPPTNITPTFITCFKTLKRQKCTKEVTVLHYPTSQDASLFTYMHHSPPPAGWAGAGRVLEHYS